MSAARDISADFASRLKAMRENRGMNQRALAAALDGVISQSGISRMEKGEKSPSPSELIALSWALGVDVSEFTDPIPLNARKTWAARSTGHVNVTDALDRLTAQLQLRNILDEVNAHRVS